MGRIGLFVMSEVKRTVVVRPRRDRHRGEVGLFTVLDGKITREEFFYAAG